ncbi:globin domain-containing protein [Streptomyces netropsis]|uniref:nitric oxide dioxygenase n=1 Tax=Streptomyces netropsis TaxID=55404 RepID=A0A7W7L8N8_STRNE|nr:globin domain-containing protein [Streptomyces netropsis]MBB4885442.1 NAD(P)H-flavin reductase [Streptomyces netropsis]GGR38186.1 oxidoreductase [Streptomyces netropsis]
MTTVNADYHALLARHDAMRLRRQLLAPGQHPDGTRSAHEAARSYDGAADQRVITDHLALVTPFDGLISHLYDAMFAQRPFLRSLFPASMEFQRMHLADILRYLIENLHRPEEIVAVFTRLGRDHRKLGVRPAHFATFEAALREALRRAAGPRWSEVMEGAWLRMLRFAVAAMVEGAEAALAEPPAWQATVTAHQVRRPGLAVLRVRPHEPYPYRAGQYASVASPLLPQAWRQYSLARAPRPDGELEFHVRQTGTGGVSEALVAHTRAGDTLRLGPAGGTMTLEENLTRDVLLVAGDTGWAPAKALLEELAARRTTHRGVHLFLDARSGLYDIDSPTDLERRHSWLRVVPVLGEGPATDPYRRLAEVVGRHGDWSEHVAFVSGPPALVGATVDRLAGAHLPAARIRHDPLPAAAPSARHRTAVGGAAAGDG